MSVTTPQASPLDATDKELLTLSQKRLEKFATLFPRALIRDDPETIHDARVWSRRLQQSLRVLFPKGTTKKGRKLVRTLRRVRRALGNCRNLDVIMELTQEKIAGAANPVVRDAWDHLKVHIQERRRPEILRAREKLSQYDIVDFVNRAQTLLSRVGSTEDSKGTLAESVAQALKDWDEAANDAQQNREPEQLHALRIAGKRLRYRLELLAELDENPAKAQIKTLKILQDQLGLWHDRYVLSRFIGEFLGRKDFLADHPGLSRALLLEMERDRRRNEAAVSNILQSSEKIRQAWSSGEVAALDENSQ